jgi:hypothetical protein
MRVQLPAPERREQQRLVPRALLASDFFRLRILLFDHQVSLVPLDDPLDIGHLVAWNHGETSPDFAQRLVLATVIGICSAQPRSRLKCAASAKPTSPCRVAAEFCAQGTSGDVGSISHDREKPQLGSAGASQQIDPTKQMTT